MQCGILRWPLDPVFDTTPLSILGQNEAYYLAYKGMATNYKRTNIISSNTTRNETSALIFGEILTKKEVVFRILQVLFVRLLASDLAALQQEISRSRWDWLLNFFYHGP